MAERALVRIQVQTFFHLLFLALPRVLSTSPMLLFFLDLVEAVIVVQDVYVVTAVLIIVLVAAVTVNVVVVIVVVYVVVLLVVARNLYLIQRIDPNLTY